MKQRNESPQINASSMADIAFLLLIFFLVTTTIDVDKGITVKLPPWCEGPECKIEAPSNRVFSVMVNSNDQLLVEQKEEPIAELRKSTKTFIREQKRDVDQPSKAVISLRNDRGTAYATYLEVYNELKAAYREIWEEEASERHQIAYENLDKVQQRAIRSDYPLVISEAEPTDFANQ